VLRWTRQDKRDVLNRGRRHQEADKQYARDGNPRGVLFIRLFSITLCLGVTCVIFKRIHSFPLLCGDHDRWTPTVSALEFRL
jgi:hypothetical protein